MKAGKDSNRGFSRRLWNIVGYIAEPFKSPFQSEPVDPKRTPRRVRSKAPYSSKRTPRREHKAAVESRRRQALRKLKGTALELFQDRETRNQHRKERRQERLLMEGKEKLYEKEKNEDEEVEVRRKKRKRFKNYNLSKNLIVVNPSSESEQDSGEGNVEDNGHSNVVELVADGSRLFRSYEETLMSELLNEASAKLEHLYDLSISDQDDKEEEETVTKRATVRGEQASNVPCEVDQSPEVSFNLLKQEKLDRLAAFGASVASYFDSAADSDRANDSKRRRLSIKRKSENQKRLWEEKKGNLENPRETVTSPRPEVQIYTTPTAETPIRAKLRPLQVTPTQLRLSQVKLSPGIQKPTLEILLTAQQVPKAADQTGGFTPARAAPMYQFVRSSFLKKVINQEEPVVAMTASEYFQLPPTAVSNRLSILDILNSASPSSPQVKSFTTEEVIATSAQGTQRGEIFIDEESEESEEAFPKCQRAVETEPTPKSVETIFKPSPGSSHVKTWSEFSRSQSRSASPLAIVIPNTPVGARAHHRNKRKISNPLTTGNGLKTRDTSVYNESTNSSMDSIRTNGTTKRLRKIYLVPMRKPTIAEQMRRKYEEAGVICPDFSLTGN